MEGKWCTESVHVLPHKPKKEKGGKKGRENCAPSLYTLLHQNPIKEKGESF